MELIEIPAQDIPGGRKYIAKADGQTVGQCAFKYLPADRRIVITFHTYASFEGKGYATQMVQKLIAVAKNHDSNVRITARTLPLINASTKVLKKNGFLNLGRIQDPKEGEVWEWSLPEFEEGTYGRDGCGG